jgi:hypothetical protein
MTTEKARLKAEIERIEKEIKITHWGLARTRLRKRLWNMEIKLANLERGAS